MRRVYALLPADQFPHAVRVAPHLFPDLDESFDFGTDVILDAIERLAPSRTIRSPTPTTERPHHDASFPGSRGGRRARRPGGHAAAARPLPSSTSAGSSSHARAHVDHPAAVDDAGRHRRRSGKITWATYRDVGTLDPIQAFDYPENTVDHRALRLARSSSSPDGSLAAGISSLPEHPDDTTTIFTLKAGARFSDGKPVTAADVVFSLKRAAGPEGRRLLPRGLHPRQVDHGDRRPHGHDQAQAGPTTGSTASCRRWPASSTRRPTRESKGSELRHAAGRRSSAPARTRSSTWNAGAEPDRRRPTTTTGATPQGEGQRDRLQGRPGRVVADERPDHRRHRRLLPAGAVARWTSSRPTTRSRSPRARRTRWTRSSSPTSRARSATSASARRCRSRSTARPTSTPSTRAARRSRATSPTPARGATAGTSSRPTGRSCPR